MTTLNETAQRILAILEEAGEADVPLIMCSVLEPSGSPDELSAIADALEVLVRADFIRMSISRDEQSRLVRLSQNESLGSIAELREAMRYGLEGAGWTDTRIKGPPYPESFPYVVTSQAGLSMAQSLLEKRGWEWWNPRVKTK
jgi:hypothetical protein